MCYKYNQVNKGEPHIFWLVGQCCTYRKEWEKQFEPHNLKANLWILDLNEHTQIVLIVSLLWYNFDCISSEFNKSFVRNHFQLFNHLKFIVCVALGNFDHGRRTIIVKVQDGISMLMGLALIHTNSIMVSLPWYIRQILVLRVLTKPLFTHLLNIRYWLLK